MSERLTFRHQPAHPKTKKQNANPYKKDQATYPPKKRKNEKKNANPKTQTVFPDQDSDSNLEFFVATPYTHKSD